MHGVDINSIKSSPGSPEPIDNTNFSVILEAPQVFGYFFWSNSSSYRQEMMFKCKKYSIFFR